MSVSVTEKGDLLEFVTNNGKQKTVTFQGSSLEIRLKDGRVNVEVIGEGDSKTVQTNIQGGVSDGMWHTIALYLQESAEGNNM